jgi:hypothetical protein
MRRLIYFCLALGSFAGFVAALRRLATFAAERAAYEMGSALRALLGSTAAPLPPQPPGGLGALLWICLLSGIACTILGCVPRGKATVNQVAPANRHPTWPYERLFL